MNTLDSNPERPTAHARPPEGMLGGSGRSEVQEQLPLDARRCTQVLVASSWSAATRYRVTQCRLRRGHEPARGISGWARRRARRYPHAAAVEKGRRWRGVLHRGTSSKASASSRPQAPVNFLALGRAPANGIDLWPAHAGREQSRVACRVLDDGRPNRSEAGAWDVQLRRVETGGTSMPVAPSKYPGVDGPRVPRDGVAVAATCRSARRKPLPRRARTCRCCLHNGSARPALTVEQRAYSAAATRTRPIVRRRRPRRARTPLAPCRLFIATRACSSWRRSLVRRPAAS